MFINVCLCICRLNYHALTALTSYTRIKFTLIDDLSISFNFSVWHRKHEDVDRNMLFKLKVGSRTRGHKQH